MMDNKKINVAKFIVLAVIVSISIEAVSTAPVNTNIGENDRESCKLSGGTKKLTSNDEKCWRNSCGSVGTTTKNPNSDTNSDTNSMYTSFRESLKLEAKDLNESFVEMTNINTSEIGKWEKFHNNSYVFLPIKPTGLVSKWHEDIQIYVASFLMLRRMQEEQDYIDNNYTTSIELEKLFYKAKEILCQIEHFLNATTSKVDIKLAPHPRWFTWEDMNNKIAAFPKDKKKLNNVFVKARFEKYIDKMLRRLEKFSIEKNLKSLEKKGRAGKGRRKPSKKPQKHRKGRKNTRSPRSTTEYTGAMSSSPKTFIITTKKIRRGTRWPRSTRGSRRPKKTTPSLQE